MILEPSFGYSTGMLWIIILLEDNVVRSIPIILQAILEIILHDLHIEWTIHPSINLDSISNSIPEHTPPYHHCSPSKLDTRLYQPITQTLALLFPSPFLSI